MANADNLLDRFVEQGKKPPSYWQEQCRALVVDGATNFKRVLQELIRANEERTGAILDTAKSALKVLAIIRVKVGGILGIEADTAMKAVEKDFEQLKSAYAKAKAAAFQELELQEPDHNDPLHEHTKQFTRHHISAHANASALLPMLDRIIEKELAKGTKPTAQQDTPESESDEPNEVIFLDDEQPPLPNNADQGEDEPITEFPGIET